VLMWGKRLHPLPHTTILACGLCLRFAPDRFFLTKPNTSGTIEVPASLRSENCSSSSRSVVHVPFGISVRLRRNPQKRRSSKVSTSAPEASIICRLTPTVSAIAGITLRYWRVETPRIRMSSMRALSRVPDGWPKGGYDKQTVTQASCRAAV